LGKHSGEPSSPTTLKLFGKERLAGGSRPLEVGRAGNAGGKSFGFSSSSLRRSESNISSNELRTIIDGDADNIIFFQNLRIQIPKLFTQNQPKKKTQHKNPSNSSSHSENQDSKNPNSETEYRKGKHRGANSSNSFIRFHKK
ncbi:hypothetical protein PanWU01x14_265570, partial [Parasponia andersonii]